MKARDIMTAPVMTASPDASVKSIAETFLRYHISAVPVVDRKNHVIGIISERDLLHRAETGTEKQRPWWLRMFVSADQLANEYVKAHAEKVRDVMVTDVVTASPDTPLSEIADLMEKHSIKRVLIVENGELVGLVSLANLVQAIATAGRGLEIRYTDSKIRDRLLAQLKVQNWAYCGLMNVTVKDGIVDLWGYAQSEPEQKAIRVAAEATPGVIAVNDHLRLSPASLGRLSA